MEECTKIGRKSIYTDSLPIFLTERWKYLSIAYFFTLLYFNLYEKIHTYEKPLP